MIIDCYFCLKDGTCALTLNDCERTESCGFESRLNYQDYVNLERERPGEPTTA